MFRFVLAVTLALGLASVSGFVAAYPTKPIRIIVPYTPGGSSDILARAIGERLSRNLGQPVIVENRPGANGNIGAQLVARSAPDGHVLLLTDIGALCINPSVYPAPRLDPGRDFAPITMISYSPHLLAVHPSVPANNVRQLIELAKAKPGELDLATPGVGSAPHLAGIEFAHLTGIRWTYVPYKGGSQAMVDVVAGHADVVMNGMLPTYPLVTSGKLKAIAVSALKRSPAAPDLPTISESGVPGFETGSWQGLLAAAGTPDAIIEVLNKQVGAILDTAPMRKQLAAQGTEVRSGPPGALRAFIENETARWAKVVKAAGVKFESRQ